MDRAKQAILMRRMALMADRHARRKATEAINATVYLEGVERYYNIVLALLRIVRHHNDRCGRWHSPAVRDLDKAERRLKSLGIPCDDKSIVIETIIRNAVTIHFPNDENN